MKIIAISDTHDYSLENILKGITGDVLVIAGDITMSGTRRQLKAFAEELKAVRSQFKRVVWIGGNHDRLLEIRPLFAKAIAKYTNSDYLNRTGIVIDGVKFWGDPGTPDLPSWAFSYPRVTNRWDAIPDDTDVLVTHSPCYGILDSAPASRHSDLGLMHYGCYQLRTAVLREVKPKIHIHGHIHHSHGSLKIEGTRFYNVAICDEDYEGFAFSS